MEIVHQYSHLNGLEFIIVHKPSLWEEIQAVVRNVDAEKCRTKISRERRMEGRALYSPIEMNKALKVGFVEHGWYESRTSYWVTEDAQLIRKTIQLSP